MRFLRSFILFIHPEYRIPNIIMCQSQFGLSRFFCLFYQTFAAPSIFFSYISPCQFYYPKICWQKFGFFHTVFHPVPEKWIIFVRPIVIPYSLLFSARAIQKPEHFQCYRKTLNNHFQFSKDIKMGWKTAQNYLFSRCILFIHIYSYYYFVFCGFQLIRIVHKCPSNSQISKRHRPP